MDNPPSYALLRLFTVKIFVSSKIGALSSTKIWPYFRMMSNYFRQLIVDILAQNFFINVIQSDIRYNSKCIYPL